MREMVGRVPLLDEILVIDSASTDRTREIAEAEGARVVQHPDVLSRYGSFRGKGEALWKSLYETTGDIIVWADTDVRNWHPRMVYGTLGPLLHEPRLQYVKGYYQRPIVEDGVLKEGGGGRVTELVARPLINLFYPELSGMIQPLAGEYAGRRSLLETIPFFTGYAVEIGHLIDAAERVGIEGLGQVDLERRVHRNQELEGPVADVVRDPPGRHEAARGAAQGAPVRRDGLDDEAAALGHGPAVARGHRARRPGAPADDPHPRVPRAPAAPRAAADPLEAPTSRSTVSGRPRPHRPRPRALDLTVRGRHPRASRRCSSTRSRAARRSISSPGVTIEDAAAWWARPRRPRSRTARSTAFVARRRRRPHRRLDAAHPVAQPELAAPRRDRQGPRPSRRPGGSGIGRALMTAAEARARAEGRWLLILDTVTGSRRRGHLPSPRLAASSASCRTTP